METFEWRGRYTWGMGMAEERAVQGVCSAEAILEQGSEGSKGANCVEVAGKGNSKRKNGASKSQEEPEGQCGWNVANQGGAERLEVSPSQGMDRGRT